MNPIHERQIRHYQEKKRREMETLFKIDHHGMRYFVSQGDNPMCDVTEERRQAVVIAMQNCDQAINEWRT